MALIKANNLVTGENHISTVTGQLENHFISQDTFNEQLYSFGRSRVCADPSSSKLVYKNFSTGELMPSNANPDFYKQTRQDEQIRKKIKSKRIKNDDPESEEFKGPWAPYEGDGIFDTINQKPKKLEFVEEEETEEKVKEEKKKERQPELDPFNMPEEAPDVQNPDFEPYSTFHIPERTDYQGKTFLDSVNDRTLVKDLTKSFIPKRLLHVFTGHKKGVQVVKFLPKFGTFLLSGSFDGTAKLWSVYGKRSLVQTYVGHTAGIRDLCFSNDGKTFITGGFDSRIQLWDTETGQAISTFHVQKHPYCLRFHPDDDKQNFFLNASMNHKIEQYDIRTSKRTVMYQDHMGAVNSVVFCDNNKRFVSCGDDKKIYLWEFGVPIVIKHIADASVNAVTKTVPHPNGRYFLGQTQSNKVLVFNTQDAGLRANKKKKFQGHQNSGYSIGLTTSSKNGNFIASGDQDGRIFFWDWKKCSNLFVMNAHEKVTIDVDWSPNEKGMLASCSWDGTVRLWGA